MSVKELFLDSLGKLTRKDIQGLMRLSTRCPPHLLKNMSLHKQAEQALVREQQSRKSRGKQWSDA
jgi:hypothetical protein